MRFIEDADGIRIHPVAGRADRIERNPQHRQGLGLGLAKILLLVGVTRPGKLRRRLAVRQGPMGVIPTVVPKLDLAILLLISEPLVAAVGVLPQ